MFARRREEERRFVERRELLLQLLRPDLLHANYNHNRVLLVFSEDIQGIQNDPGHEILGDSML